MTSSSQDADDQPGRGAFLAIMVVPLLFVVVLVVRVIIDHPGAASSTSQPTVLSMSFAGPCESGSSGSLAVDPMVFEAKVSSVDDAEAVLVPSRVFAGRPSASVAVDLPATPPPARLRMPTFTKGQTYLVAVDEAGSVVGCGLSGPETSSLENTYTSAFGGGGV